MKWLKEGKTSGSQFELVEIFLWATANWASPLIRTFTCNGQQIEITILKTNQSNIHINKMTLLRCTSRATILCYERFYTEY